MFPYSPGIEVGVFSNGIKKSISFKVFLTFVIGYIILIYIFVKVVRKRSRSSSLQERMTDALEGHFKKNALKVAFEPCG